jgi:acetylornithine deacetylase
MLEAGRRLLEEGIDDFGYLWVVGEETDNAGARKANELVRCEHLIVGEPTENLLARGHKGVFRAVLRAVGTAAHSAYPQRGDSAIHRLLDALERIRQLDFGSDPVLGPSTINIGGLRGGVAFNILAPEAEADILIRVVTSLEEVEGALRKALEDPVAGVPDPRLSLRGVHTLPKARTAGLPGFPETVVAYGTDIPYMKDIGTPYLIGPGSILDAHTENEKISKRSMLDAVEIYTRMVKTLLS